MQNLATLIKTPPPMSIAAGAPLPMPPTPAPVWLFPIPLRFGVASCTEISGRGSEGGRSKNSAKERRNVKRCETDGRAATGGGECARAQASESVREGGRAMPAEKGPSVERERPAVASSLIHRCTKRRTRKRLKVEM